MENQGGKVSQGTRRTDLTVRARYQLGSSANHHTQQTCQLQRLRWTDDGAANVFGAGYDPLNLGAPQIHSLETGAGELRALQPTPRKSRAFESSTPKIRLL